MGLLMTCPHRRERKRGKVAQQRDCDADRTSNPTINYLVKTAGISFNSIIKPEVQVGGLLKLEYFPGGGRPKVGLC